MRVKFKGIYHEKTEDVAQPSKSRFASFFTGRNVRNVNTPQRQAIHLASKSEILSRVALEVGSDPYAVDKLTPEQITRHFDSFRKQFNAIPVSPSNDQEARTVKRLRALLNADLDTIGDALIVDGPAVLEKDGWKSVGKDELKGYTVWANASMPELYIVLESKTFILVKGNKKTERQPLAILEEALLTIKPKLIDTDGLPKPLTQNVNTL